MPFDGETYVPAMDKPRLNAQMTRVMGIMADGKWRTLRDLEAITGDPQASISARLRDLRKAKFGGHTVDRLRISGGTYQYRLTLFVPGEAGEQIDWCGA